MLLEFSIKKSLYNLIQWSINDFQERRWHYGSGRKADSAPAMRRLRKKRSSGERLSIWHRSKWLSKELGKISIIVAMDWLNEPSDQKGKP